MRIVRQLRLDDLVGAARPIMLKIDVEEYEGRVLGGAIYVLGAPELKVIELETITSGFDELLGRTGV